MAEQAIQVMVVGAGGRMGREAVKTLTATEDLHLHSLIDPKLGELAQISCVTAPEKPIAIKTRDLHAVLRTNPPTVGLELTRPNSVFDNTCAMIDAGVIPVVGATGLSEEQWLHIDKALRDKNLPGAIIPNFAIGAVLLMEFAAKAAKYFDHAEIIELHHNQKADAPSGTALLTAKRMADVQAGEQPAQFGANNAEEKETLPGARGGLHESGLRIHSVRLPGLVAHQEVLLGAEGQLLTLKHDSFNRSSFMPGIVQAVRSIVRQPPGLIVGLEHLL